MTGQAEALSLLEDLKARFGVDASDRLHGPSVIVPNDAYRPEWTQVLAEAGYKVFSTVHEGRSAWLIPIQPRRVKPGDDQPPPPAKDNAGALRSQAGQGDASMKGCITGRPWTQTEDIMLLNLLSKGASPPTIARELSAKLNRSEEAIKGRVRKLKRRRGTDLETSTSKEKLGFENSEKSGPPEFEPGKEPLRSLLESAILLTGDPKHIPALKVLLEACLHQTTLTTQRKMNSASG